MELQTFNFDGDIYVRSHFHNEGSNILIDPTFGSGINSETDFSRSYETFCIIMYSWLPHSKYRSFNAVSS